MPARGQPSYIEYDASSLDVSLVDELEDFAYRKVCKQAEPPSIIQMEGDWQVAGYAKNVLGMVF